MENRFLCRGKRSDTGEWVEGFLVPFADDDKHRSWTIKKVDDIKKPSISQTVKVDPSTICQCTGLVDKNGKLIFENDIVKDNVIYGVVKWDDTNAGYFIDDRDTGYQDYSEWWHEVEAVGNVFDNPELLEVQP